MFAFHASLPSKRIPRPLQVCQHFRNFYTIDLNDAPSKLKPTLKITNTGIV